MVCGAGRPFREASLGGAKNVAGSKLTALAPRPSLRTVQKEMTRDRLREAARALFFSSGYAAATVEQIAAVAGASRATFYLHFKDKDEVLQDIALDYAPRALAVMRRLKGPLPTHAEIRAWLCDWVDLVAAERASTMIFTEVAQHGMPPYVQDIVDQIILTLGERIPAFRAATLPGPLQLEARVWTDMLIAQGTRACGHAARGRDKNYSDMSLDVVATLFERFIHDPRFG
jgi:AcrR family transcriptional regulator